MNYLISSLPFPNNFLNSSHSPFVFGLICGSLLGTSMNVGSFISLRRLIIQGIPAGVVSYLGSAISETFFLFLILFGYIGVIEKWFTLEPSLTFIITVFCADTIIGFLLDNRLKIVSLSQTTDLLKIFLCNAVIVFGNPGSTWGATSLITSIEGFQFRENSLFLFGVFLGIFVIGCGIGFLILALTNLWMIQSSKTFRSLIYRSNKIISHLALCILILSTIYYHWQVYIGLSLSTSSMPMITITKHDREPFYTDDESQMSWNRYKNKVERKNQPHPMKTLGGLPIKQFGQWFKKNVITSNPEDLDARGLPRERTKTGDYVPNYETMQAIRNKKWFSRSKNYLYIKEKIFSLLSINPMKVKFLEHSRRDMDLFYLGDKKSTRITITEMSKSDYHQMLENRKQRIQNIINTRN
nr:hypothetical chloroplast RF1 [Mesostigma viride]